ncbi:hypothetical protein BGZ95_010779 [Linnemannia exigua]|uniref:DNA helicase n=1 Tax=Linnemannia exigua TaxID=604196 RepID=A0AAD4HA91_9FUNG|nr:hypothetical protein BGZ95_010779 [Linnemannia exigua]
MSALQRLQEFRFKKAQEAVGGNKSPAAAPGTLTATTTVKTASPVPTTTTSHIISRSSTPTTSSSSSSNNSSRDISKERRSGPLIVPGSSDIELDSDSDVDLRKGVNNLSTYSPARRMSPKASGSPKGSVSKTSSSLSASQSSHLSSQTTLPFKKLVGSFRYTGQDAMPGSSPSDLLSDQSLSSPGQSESDEDNDVVMTGARNGNSGGSNGHSNLTKPFKRQIVSSDDEDDIVEIKPRRRLVKKGDLNRAATTSDVQVPQRRRLVKRALLNSDSDDSKTYKPIMIPSDDADDDDDVRVASTLDETLAQLQNSFPDAKFRDLKAALDEADGEYGLAAALLTSKNNNLFDLSNDQHSDAEVRVHSSHSAQNNRLDRLMQKPSSFKAIPMPVKSAPVPARQKAQSVESDAFSEDSGDSYDEGGRSTYYAQDRKEERALEFFNEATMLELQELSGCSKTQATGVIALRPFDNFDQMCVLLRKTKGVGERIVNSYLTTTDAIRAVDNMLKTVDRVREDLVGTLSVWCGDENGKLFESGTNSNKVTEGTAGTADGEEEDEPGMGLLNVDVDRASTTPEGRAAMKHFIRRQPRNMASGFQLKGYQLLGINWLALLWRKKLSGILADEMGLGKTAQVIAFLAHLKETGEEGPFLIVVPASTISNWMREFDRFCPELDVRSYYGSQAEREEMRYELEQDPTYNVIVTTYSLAAGNNDERKFLNRRNFKGIVLDEGHMIKNCSSARYKQLMSIKTSFRLLLTGTPLQNNLEELLSLMVFIMPKLFAEHEEVLRTMFKVKVDATSEKSTLLSQERIIRARHMLAPFVLRRKKVHVLKDLPRKVEHVIYCDLLPAQRTLYDTVMKSSTLQDVLEDQLDAEPDVIELDSMSASDKAKSAAGKKAGPKKQTAASKKATATAFANILMQLRKAADHPMLFRELYADATLKKMAKVITQEIEFCDSNIDYVEEDMTVMTDFELDRLCKQYKSVNKFALPGEPWMEACKVRELQKLLLRLINEENSRVLIFSQFTMVLDILEPVMQTMGFKYLRMDGSSKVEERQPMIDSFNDDQSNKVFLLSTKAGGFGINLTGANVVIMFDLDYNPHNVKQAEDRAHRVGQTRQVDVYKLIGRNTIEEQIYQLANLKLKLDQHVSQDDAAKASTESSASGSSTPSAGILSLIKQSWKASHGTNTSIRP